MGDFVVDAVVLEERGVGCVLLLLNEGTVGTVVLLSDSKHGHFVDCGGGRVERALVTASLQVLQIKHVPLFVSVVEVFGAGRATRGVTVQKF